MSTISEYLYFYIIVVSFEKVRFLAQALEIVETRCSKSLDGYHLKIEDACINVLWFLNVEMA